MPPEVSADHRVLMRGCASCANPRNPSYMRQGLTLKRQWAMAGWLSADGAADLTRGDGPYAGSAIGLASGLPALARCWAVARVPLSNPPRLWTFGLVAAQGPLPLAPADRRWRRRSGSASGSGGVRAVAAARAARRAALKPYRKFSHGEREQS